VNLWIFLDENKYKIRIERKKKSFYLMILRTFQQQQVDIYQVMQIDQVEQNVQMVQFKSCNCNLIIVEKLQKMSAMTILY
jgi:hypothetical protein